MALAAELWVEAEAVEEPVAEAALPLTAPATEEDPDDAELLATDLEVVRTVEAPVPVAYGATVLLPATMPVVAGTEAVERAPAREVDAVPLIGTGETAVALLGTATERDETADAPSADVSTAEVAADVAAALTAAELRAAVVSAAAEVAAAEVSVAGAWIWPEHSCQLEMLRILSACSKRSAVQHLNLPSLIWVTTPASEVAAVSRSKFWALSATTRALPATARTEKMVVRILMMVEAACGVEKISGTKLLRSCCTEGSGRGDEARYKW